jgi:cytidylate kinase
LIVPDGAVIIDTSDMTVDEVVDSIVGLARKAAD